MADDSIKEKALVKARLVAAYELRKSATIIMETDFDDIAEIGPELELLAHRATEEAGKAYDQLMKSDAKEAADGGI